MAAATVPPAPATRITRTSRNRAFDLGLKSALMSLGAQHRLAVGSPGVTAWPAPGRKLFGATGLRKVSEGLMGVKAGRRGGGQGGLARRESSGGSGAPHMLDRASPPPSGQRRWVAAR